MKIGIMQPYFFPYVGYFSLIRDTDLWIVFDDVQFIRHGWIERNRVLNSNQSWQYIKVPLVKGPRDTKIKDMKIRNEESWKKTIFDQLTCYKKKARYYPNVIQLLEEIFSPEIEDITSLNVYAMEKVCSYLGIPFNYIVYSKNQIDVGRKIQTPDDWALQIAIHFGADEYINPYGGESIFDKEKYEQNNMKIRFLKNNLPKYDQKISVFEPGLSILDVLMFNSPDEALKIVEDYQYI